MKILLIARLFADEHDLGFAAALPKDRLRRLLIQVTPPAALDRLAERGEARAIGELGRGPGPSGIALEIEEGHGPVVAAAGRD